MNKQRRSELDQMLKEWAAARQQGVFDALGWHSGGSANEHVSKAVGKSNSNAAQVAELTRLRQDGYADALMVHGALQIATIDNRQSILALKYRYLFPGTWEKQTKGFSFMIGGMTKEAYRQYVTTGLFALDAELQNIGRSTEPVPTYPLEKVTSE